MNVRDRDERSEPRLLASVALTQTGRRGDGRGGRERFLNPTWMFMKNIFSYDISYDHLHEYYYYTHINLLLEDKMATHSSILAWTIPWTKEPGRL